MAASFECKIATLSNINTSSGKAVFSGTLEKQAQLACVVSAVSWCMGIMTFQREKETKTPSQPVKCKNPKYLYISTNYCLSDKELN